MGSGYNETNVAIRFSDPNFVRSFEIFRESRVTQVLFESIDLAGNSAFGVKFGGLGIFTPNGNFISLPP
jgi:hypothetical protein